MPKVKKYLDGFNLYKGLELDGYKLIYIHNTIKRYKEYEYPTKMIWQRIILSNNDKKFINKLQSMLTSKTIYHIDFNWIL